MKACYIDCSPFMRDMMSDAGLKIPDELRLHIGDPAPGALVNVIADAEVVLNGHTYMDAGILRALPNVRHIVYLGTGATSYIDVAVAAECGIEVSTIRGYGDRSVAEHAFALTMACARQITRMDRQMRDGIWEPLSGIELGGRTLGIIGAGGIGLQLASMARGFGMKVLIWNRSAITGEWQGYQTAIEHLLANSDVVSLHLALTPETKHFFDADHFRQMKKGAILINTARAGLVDEAAMIDALETGHLAHAGLDVFEPEPLPAAHPLTRQTNITMTPHVAYKTPEASIRLVKLAFDLAFKN